MANAGNGISIIAGVFKFKHLLFMVYFKLKWNGFSSFEGQNLWSIPLYSFSRNQF
jgi:hypothetical protein